MTRFHTVVALSALLLGAAATVVAVTDTATPLKEAVEALNLKMPSDYFDENRGRTPALAKDKRPTAVTTDEVVEAIRGWDRKKVPVADATYQIYEKIAESKALPTGAKLWVRDEWKHPGGEDKYEYRVWRVELNVMTGKDAVYSFVVREQRLDRRVALLAAPRFSWLQEPLPIRLSGGYSGSNSKNRIIMLDEVKDGALLVTVVEQQSEEKRSQEVRFVAFDADGTRYLADRAGGSAMSGIMVGRYRLNPKTLLAEKVRYLGVEGSIEPTRAELKQASEAAVKQAKEKGIEVLPLPEVGRPYEFALTTTEGKVFDSRKLSGKVVVVDCWASWCVPCIAKMPEVKKMYEKWHEKGLDVVGLSLDEDPKAAAAAAKKLELPWPLVVVPAGEEARNLWTQASRIRRVPRLFVIDRKGVLRAELSSAEELEKTVAGLLAENPSP
jgi:thiol-disulfide isomerase/thioredoxin